MPKSLSNKAFSSASPGIGGSYSKDPVTGELTLIEPPTAEAVLSLPATPAQLPEPALTATPIEIDQEIQS